MASFLFPPESKYQIQLKRGGRGKEGEGGQSQSSAAAAPSPLQRSKQLYWPCWWETSASRRPAALRHPLKTDAPLCARRRSAPPECIQSCSHIRAVAFCSAPSIPVSAQTRAQSRPWSVQAGRQASRRTERGAEGRGWREDGGVNDGGERGERRGEEREERGEERRGGTAAEWAVETSCERYVWSMSKRSNLNPSTTFSGIT